MEIKNTKTNEKFSVKFIEKVVKSKVSKLIKEINDLCLNLFRVNNKSDCDEWILATPTNEDETEYTISYKKFIFSIKSLRTKVIRKKELLSNNKRAATITSNTLAILDNANSKGYISNYKSLRRKYITRLRSQNTKTSYYANKHFFVPTIRNFYLLLHKGCLQGWYGGQTPNAFSNETPTKNILEELETQIMEENIIHMIESFEN